MIQNRIMIQNDSLTLIILSTVDLKAGEMEENDNEVGITNVIAKQMRKNAEQRI